MDFFNIGHHLVYFTTCPHCIEHQCRCYKQTHSPVPAGNRSSVRLGVVLGWVREKRKDRKEEQTLFLTLVPESE